MDSTWGGEGRIDGRQYTTNTNFTRRYEYVNANNTLFNNYIDGGINGGQLMYAQDIVDTVEDNVRRAVDLIEGRINSTYQVINACHASCHSSCHMDQYVIHCHLVHYTLHLYEYFQYHHVIQH